MLAGTTLQRQLMGLVQSYSLGGAMCTPCNLLPWTHPSTHPKWHFNPFSCFAQLTTESPYFTMGRPLKLSLPISDLDRLIMLPWAHQSPQTKQHLDWISPFCTAYGRRSLYFTMCCPFLPQNYPLHIGESELLFNTWFLGPTWVDFPNNMTTGSAVFAGLTIVTDKRLKAPLFVNFGSSINQSINWLNKRTDRPLTLTCMNTCRKTFHNTHEYKIQRLGMGEWAASHVAHSLIFTYMECYDGYPELYLAVCAVHFCLYAFRHNTFT